MDHAQNGGEDAKRRKGIGQGLPGTGYGVHLIMMNVELAVHDRLDFMGVAGAQCQQSQIVAQEFNGMMVLGELGKLLKEGLSSGFSTWVSSARSLFVLARWKTAQRTPKSSR